MKEKIRIRTAVLIVMMVTGLCAYADPVVTISDGVTTAGPFTIPGGVGSVNISLDSSWPTVNISSISTPATGSVSAPEFDLTFVATSAGSANPLTVTVSEQNLGPTAGNNNAFVDFVGHTISGSGGSITFNTYYDTNNALNGQTTALTASGTLPGSPYSSSGTNSLSAAAPYSLTEVLTIDGTQQASYSLVSDLNVTNQPCACTISFNCPSNMVICANQPVPDGATEASQIMASDTCLGTVPVSFLGAATNGTCPSVITYTFGATSGCGVLSTCTQTITVDCLPDAGITTVSNAIVGTTNLMACVNNAGTGATYVWTINNGTITAGQGTSCITYTAGTDTTAPVTVCVTVTSAAGCEATSCAMVPLIPQSCPCASHSIQYNFNGTQIIFQSTPGGSYVWFISDGKVNGLPNNKKVTLHISGQSITIPQTPPMTAPITIPVPDAFITFDPSATIATTTFDTVNNVWRETFPPSGLSGNIFYGGVAFKVPATGLPGGIKNVDWTGTFTTDTAGVNLQWQWSAANYSDFTANYNSIAPKPTDDNQKSIYQNSDHAGTPEGTDTVSGKQWKTFVVGGASGGGGANYTGSGSSTISVTPCVCPNP